ncbi:MAG: penicillin-binding transpeptidase domain-containing protein [Defluviitaleaceae bacterium]|nr:penicillin-binding transpeptidase domain-containing protein [Defluviitaleaceae bacterium]
MTDIKKYIRQVFWFFFILFTSVVVYLSYFYFVLASDIKNYSMNPRVRISRPNILRGRILDRNGVILAFSDEDGRYYPMENVFSHVVGHTSVGHSGIEERYNFNLTNLSNELWQRIKNLSTGSVLQGDDIHTTLDYRIQNFAYNLLNQRGSIVLMQPSTGNILAMVSYPSYNPNTAEYFWDYLAIGSESPLLNRATQGLYPPGSTFKIFPAALSVRERIDFNHFCNGYITINGTTIRCFHSTPHGNVDLNRAFYLSCNTYFVALANYMGYENFTTGIEEYFKEISFSLAHNQSRFNFENGIDNLILSAIGQGRTVVTPLYMAMVSSAISNGGIMNMPNIVNNNSIFSRTHSTTLFTVEEVEKLREIMTEVVTRGTGTAAGINNMQLAGKTGTAENETDIAHGWFTGFLVDGDLAISIILENSGGTGPVLPIVKSIMQYAASLDM